MGKKEENIVTTGGYRLAENDIEFLTCELLVRLKKRKIIKYLSVSKQEDAVSVAEYLKHHSISVFPYDYKDTYDRDNVIVEKDESCNMFYVKNPILDVYMKPTYTSKFRAQRYYNNILMEQDANSPHCYISPDFYPEKDSVILDIGGAEGYFPIQYLEQVKRVYIFECNPEWLKALEKTYEKYQDKVCIVNKFVADYTDDTHVSLDAFAAEHDLLEEKLFIKIDAEGSEPSIIKGAEQLLRGEQSIKIALCVYHCAEHEAMFRERFRNWSVHASKGYMLYYYDFHFDAPYIRRGVLRISNNVDERVG